MHACVLLVLSLPPNSWEATSWAKRLARRQARAAMSDFDRFKAMKAHKKVNKHTHEAHPCIKHTASCAHPPRARFALLLVHLQRASAINKKVKATKKAAAKA